MTDREVAWRVFAGEYNNSTIHIEPEHEREPGYVITPLGAKINRIYIVGVLTDIEKLERNGNTHYKVRVSDRTGVFFIYAGQFDPNVIKTLSSLEPPAYVAVIGKSRMYSPEEGINYVSVRPEKITVVDKSIRDYWLLDACKNLKLRLEAINEAMQMEPPDLDKLVKLGFESDISQGVLESLKYYKQPDIIQYRNMLVEVLKYLVLDNGELYITPENATDQNLEQLPQEFKTGDEITEDEYENISDDELEFEPNPDIIDETNLSEDNQNQEEHEQLLLDVIKKFKGKAYKNGVPWHELIVKASDEGIDKNSVEDLVNNLLERGKVYEPMLGRIKRTS